MVFEAETIPDNPQVAEAGEDRPVVEEELPAADPAQPASVGVSEGSAGDTATVIPSVVEPKAEDMAGYPPADLPPDTPTVGVPAAETLADEHAKYLAIYQARTGYLRARWVRIFAAIDREEAALDALIEAHEVKAASAEALRSEKLGN